jgi:hypothetical protein
MMILFGALGAVKQGNAIPLPVATTGLATLSSCIQKTLTFVSDETIVVGCFPGNNGSLSGVIAAFRWRAENLGLSATKELALDRAAFTGELYAAAHGHVLSDLTLIPELLTPDLKQRISLPKGAVRWPVQQANFFAELPRNGEWRLYRLLPQIELVRTGVGQILSISDEFIVYRTDHTIRIETISGTGSGQFSDPDSTCNVDLLGSNRLLMNCHKRFVADFNGRELLRINLQGWGFRSGQSQKGERALFDNYTRTISLAKRLSEALQSVISLGMGPQVAANGETIRVLDTYTGKICFNLESPKLLGQAGEYHADISPSGHFVAILSEQMLSVYQLPQTCADADK